MHELSNRRAVPVHSGQQCLVVTEIQNATSLGPAASDLSITGISFRETVILQCNKVGLVGFFYLYAVFLEILGFNKEAGI